MQGVVNRVDARLPAPLPNLLAFLRQGITELGTHHHALLIECHSTKAISFNDLVWVGYPDAVTPLFAKIFERATDAVPERYTYDACQSIRPAEISAILENRASDFIRSKIDPSI
jgi:hypothetical protein